MNKRIYVCHTYYHVYISCLKELRAEHPDRGHATLLLSLISTDFGDLKTRLTASGLFAEVHEFDEKNHDFFPELQKYRAKRGNVLRHMINRIIFCKKLGKAQIPYLPVDFRAYSDIYVYCDSDPIGYYLNYAKIPYHALEDGLDCLANFDAARVDNRGFFGIKTWMSGKNLIFIQNGYGKYCLDMEVNDISVIKYPGPHYIAVSRNELAAGLDEAAKGMLCDIFIADMAQLRQKLAAYAGPTVLLLTQPLCDIETRKRIFTDAIDQYGQPSPVTPAPPHNDTDQTAAATEAPNPATEDPAPARVIIKPHPMDELDYPALFPKHVVLDGKFPMEILNFIPGLYFDRVVAVFTVPTSLQQVGEAIYLGSDFIKEYEDTCRYSPNELL